MVQDKQDLEKWYSSEDPWEYRTHPDDAKRKTYLLGELPQKIYKKVLDIGCGEGFVTRELPGDEVIGIDLSEQAIGRAKQAATKRDAGLDAKKLDFMALSLFDLPGKFDQEFDLMVITGVLYQQYIGEAQASVRIIVDKLLKPGGILACVHVSEWYRMRFPYFRLKEVFYQYREYTHLLEIYAK